MVRDLTNYLQSLQKITSSVNGNIQLKITGVSQRADAVKEGMIFCAIRGARADGHDFLDQAVRNGAVCCVIHETHPWEAPVEDFPVIRVTDSYFAWALLCETYQGDPAKSMDIFAVTGTNGKTTTTYVLRHILRYAYPEKKCGLVTTVEYDCGSGMTPDEGSRTTPEAMELQKLFARMKENHCSYAVMEQSSHGLHQHRSGSLQCAGAVFTNLTGDHLDYHENMENYYQAKKILFTQMLAENAPAVINLDDPYGERLYEELISEGKDVCALTMQGKAHAQASIEDIVLSLSGSDFTLVFQGERLQAHTRLSARYNICNVAQAMLLALKKGIDKETVLAAVASLKQGPPGRLEKFLLPAEAYAFVDYAHTDDALRQVLLTLRELTKGRIITLFGCGGDRDKTKRPRMALAASEYSDLVILTSDNPRTEDPSVILADAQKGFPPGTNFIVEADRAAAIEKALAEAKKSDIVLIAGKGHENYQEINGVKHHFDDREQVLQFIRNHPNKSGEI